MFIELFKREVSEDIAFKTIIKISTAYNVSSRGLIDFIINFYKNKNNFSVIWIISLAKVARSKRYKSIIFNKVTSIRVQEFNLQC